MNPSLDTNDRGARAAVDAFVAGIQRALDAHDADGYDAAFAGDVLWGSPYGRTLRGHAPLNAIHRRLHAEGRGGRSRYEVVDVSSPAPDVAVAQVRRQALEPDGLSETALYVLVRRGDRWWLAAGQNTLIA